LQKGESMNWSQKTVKSISQELQVDLQMGLSQKEAERRLGAFGPNKIPEKPRESWVSVFFRQFKSPLIYILLIAAVVIFFVGKDKFDALFVSGVLLFNAFVGTIQEGRAQTILEGLRRFIKTTCVVLRNHKKQFVDNTQLVVGDIILLQEGERVPADARIIESNTLQVDESVLTGESGSVQKTNEPLASADDILEQSNMLFKGTYILSGSGRAIVVAVGIATQIGQIHQEAVETIDPQMPLKKDINRLSYFILWFIFGICIFLFVIGWLTGKAIPELFTTLTALFICVIPEGLPVVLTLVLVSGAYALARKNVLVKRMQAVEALGRADAVVIDKTGTLTRNEMVVSRGSVGGQQFSVSGVGYFAQGDVMLSGKKVDLEQFPLLQQLGKAGALLNSSELNFLPDINLFDIKGSPTEIAMSIFAGKLGFDKANLEQRYEKVFEIPFDARLQYHAVFCKKAYSVEGKKGIAFVSGVPEKIMSLTDFPTEQTKENLSSMLNDGLRVVAVAQKEFDLKKVPKNQNGRELQDWFKNLLERDSLELLGFCGIQDSIRSEVREIIAKTRAAGIRVIMATGDHRQTALFVARAVGIFSDGDRVLEGKELEVLSAKEFCDAVRTATVFARVTPKQKLRIVNELRRQKNIVAMTGDGVNDVPSLAAADLGIAMGRIGTDAAKQASDMILLDDSFISIAKAIEYGRHIFFTLRRVVLYFFSTNAGEVLVVLGALSLGLPLPLTAVQILWLNLVTDGFLDMALTKEKKESGLMEPEARKRLSKVVDWDMLGKMLFMATPMAVFSLLIFCFQCNKDLVHARSLALVSMAMFQWFNALNCRSEIKSIFSLGFFSNKWLLAAMALVFALQVLVLHNPFMQKLFKTKPISLHEWGLVILASSSVVVLEELRKWVVRKRK